jgi:hypothetical protein
MTLRVYQQIFIVKKEVFYDRPLGQKNERLIKELIEK